MELCADAMSTDPLAHDRSGEQASFTSWDRITERGEVRVTLVSAGE